MDALLQSDPPHSNFYDETANAFQDVLDALNRQKHRINALELKIARLETALAEKAPVKYLGVHKPNAEYSEGSLVSRDGSMFYAHRRTKELPGDGNQDWQLCVKHGRDGRDGRDGKNAG